MKASKSRNLLHLILAKGYLHWVQCPVDKGQLWAEPQYTENVPCAYYKFKWIASRVVIHNLIKESASLATVEWTNTWNLISSCSLDCKWHRQLLPLRLLTAKKMKHLPGSLWQDWSFDATRNEQLLVNWQKGNPSLPNQLSSFCQLQWAQKRWQWQQWQTEMFAKSHSTFYCLLSRFII